MNTEATELIGNKPILAYLKKIATQSHVNNVNLSGAYLFSGQDDLGRFATALYFAKCLYCRATENIPCQTCSSCQQIEKETFPDLLVITKDLEKRDISIEQVREFIYQLSLSSFSGGYKIGIINGADALNLAAANALLKTLEEPNKKVIIILIVNDLTSLPQTIVSRSQVLKFKPVSDDELYDYLTNKHGVGRDLVKTIVALAAGRPGLALRLGQNPDILDDYLKPAHYLIQNLTANLNQRLTELTKLTGAKLTGQEGVELARVFINSWEKVVRDLIMHKLGQHSLVVFYDSAQALDLIKDKYSMSRLLEIESSLVLAKQYLASNANPKIVLENLVINF